MASPPDSRPEDVQKPAGTRNWVTEILDENAREVANWPAWMRHPAVRSRLPEITSLADYAARKERERRAALDRAIIARAAHLTGGAPKEPED